MTNYSPRLHASLLVTLGFVIAAVLAGCGAGGHPHKTAQLGSGVTTSASREPGSAYARPGAVVARVGNHTILGRSFNRALAAEPATEPAPFNFVPDPPNYERCIARIKGSVALLGRAGPGPSATRLRRACQQQYVAMKQRVTEQLIVDQWLIEGAREIKMTVSDASVHRRVAEQTQDPSRRPVQGSDTRSVAELMHHARALLAGEAIREALTKRAGRASPQRIEQYYASHRAQFHVPERRDLYVVRTQTAAEAKRALTGLRKGASFARVASEVKGSQPPTTEHGELHGLRPREYAEPPLNDAIFSARPGVLTGPIKIALGYYIFKVKTIHPPRQKPLSEVRAALAINLPATVKERVVMNFVRGWRSKWRRETTCNAGYVVKQCRQYKAPAKAPTEDPFTLD